MQQEDRTFSSFWGAFIMHFVLVIFVWTGPFLFHWSIMMLAYALVIAQFRVLNRCIVNELHGVPDGDEQYEQTFYSQWFEMMGFRPNRRKLKDFIRKYLHELLALFTLVWQLVLEHKPFFSF